MWTHKDHKNKTFKGDYERRKNGTVWFYLNCNENPKMIPIKLRSWQVAKKSGWVKVK